MNCDKKTIERLTAENEALRASHDKTWNAAIEAAEYVVKERAAQLSERSKRPLYSVRQKIRSLLRIRPGD